MATRTDVTIKTKNETFGEIEVNVTAEVPETLAEAAEFYGGEDKLIESIQSDVARRRANAARPILRDADTELDWQAVAQDAVDTYTPGRRGGFQGAKVSEEELKSAGSVEDLVAMLKAKGYNIV